MIRGPIMQAEGDPPAAAPATLPAAAPVVAPVIAPVAAPIAAPIAKPVIDWAAKASAAAARVLALGAKATAVQVEHAAAIEEIATLKTRADASDHAALTGRRDAALERAGVLPQYRDTAPLVDPSTQEGAKALETWLADRPHIRVAQQAGIAQAPPAPETPLGKIASGTSSLGKAGQDWYRSQMERAHG